MPLIIMPLKINTNHAPMLTNLLQLTKNQYFWFTKHWLLSLMHYHIEPLQIVRFFSASGNLSCLCTCRLKEHLLRVSLMTRQPPVRKTSPCETVLYNKEQVLLCHFVEVLCFLHGIFFLTILEDQTVLKSCVFN